DRPAPATASGGGRQRPSGSRNSRRAFFSTDGTGRRLSHTARPAPARCLGLLPVPEVRQPRDLPPAAGLRIPAPLLAPAHRALGLGVAVDRADLDLAHHGAIGPHRVAALAVAGHAQL